MNSHGVVEHRLSAPVAYGDPTRDPHMSDTATLDHELNQMILNGQAMDGFERFYADDVVMQENGDAPFEGKALNREREAEFFGAVQELHYAKLLSSAVSGDLSFSEWEWKIHFKGAPEPVIMSQVARRRWRAGQIVSERFYYNK